MTQRQISLLAGKLKKWCINNEFGDTCIYYNNRRISIDYNGNCKVEKDINVDDYFDYHGDILSMSFEGSLYEIFNYIIGNLAVEIIEEFNDIIGKYDLHFEQGDAWNLSLYE